LTDEWNADAHDGYDNDDFYFFKNCIPNKNIKQELLLLTICDDLKNHNNQRTGHADRQYIIQ
jgi:hypothetical protein